MRCAQARSAITERSRGLLGPVASAALQRHLAGCAACAAESRAEVWLVNGLPALREPFPRELDVRRQVAQRIADLGAVDRSETSVRQLGWAALVAAAGTAALLGSLWILGPDMKLSLQQAAALMMALGGLLVRAGAVLLSLAIVPFKVLAPIARALQPPASSLGTIEPLAIFVLALGYLLMAATTVFAVGRDLRRPGVVETLEDRK